MIYKCFVYFIELSFSVSMFMTAGLFASQAIKIYKTKGAKDLSITTFLGFNTIQILAISHAYIYHDYKYMFGTMLNFVFCGAISSLIWHYNGQHVKQKKKNHVAIKCFLGLGFIVVFCGFFGVINQNMALLQKS